MFSKFEKYKVKTKESASWKSVNGLILSLNVKQLHIRDNCTLPRRIKQCWFHIRYCNWWKITDGLGLVYLGEKVCFRLTAQNIVATCKFATPPSNSCSASGPEPAMSVSFPVLVGVLVGAAINHLCTVFTVIKRASEVLRGCVRSYSSCVHFIERLLNPVPRMLSSFILETTIALCPGESNRLFHIRHCNWWKATDGWYGLSGRKRLL